jgi:predicted RNase H-like nuclease
MRQDARVADERTRSGRVIGIDAAGKHGWVGILLDDGRYAGARLGALQQIVSWAEPLDTIGIPSDADTRVFEVHPEVSFRAMNGGFLDWSKKSWNGLLDRRRLLADAGIVLDDDLGVGGATVADDVVDAAAVAWSARGGGRGESSTLPDPPQESDGCQVAIWY